MAESRVNSSLIRNVCTPEHMTVMFHVSNEEKRRKMDSHKTASAGNRNCFSSIVRLACQKCNEAYHRRCASVDLGGGPSLLTFSSERGFKSYVSVHVAMCRWVRMPMEVWALDPLELDFQAVVSYPEQVLAAELGFLGTAASTLSFSASSPAPCLSSLLHAVKRHCDLPSSLCSVCTQKPRTEEKAKN